MSLSFGEFAEQRSSCPLDDDREEADVCLEAMEQGDLPVCSLNQSGCHLWEWYAMKSDQWVRVCALRPPVHLLWRKNSKVIAAVMDGGVHLGDVGYLWQDLDAAQAFVKWWDYEKHPYIVARRQWIAAQVQEWRVWQTSLRRTWLLATI